MIHTLLLHNGVTRRLLNSLYNILPFKMKERIHTRHRGRGPSYLCDSIWDERATWDVRFMESMIKVPLYNNHGWEQALTVLGYDIGVKRYYVDRLKNAPPDLFIDVGANFMTHSALFASQGIECLAYEPNTQCYQFYLDLCEHNTYFLRKVHVKRKAAGSENKQTRLFFPAGASWLGIVGDTKEAAVCKKAYTDEDSRVSLKDSMREEVIDMVTLDADIAQRYPKDTSVLLKIDVEGHEMDVLNGADKFINYYLPEIVFECFHNEQTHYRGRVWDWFHARSYSIAGIEESGELTYFNDFQEFDRSEHTNFVAFFDAAR